MERTQTNYVRPGFKLSRQQRLARKFKGVLRCEWCGRWTAISMKRWHNLYDQQKLFPAEYVYFCPRERCRTWRQEFEITPSSSNG